MIAAVNFLKRGYNIFLRAAVGAASQSFEVDYCSVANTIFSLSLFLGT